MNSKSSSGFIFTVCQIGCEATLKKEIAREHPALKFAFSKPGFLTFKNTKGSVANDFELHSVFARAYGASEGKIDAQEISKIIDLAELLTPHAQGKICLHVWERDFHPRGKEPPDFKLGVLAKALEKKIRKENPKLWAESNIAQPGDTVLDVIVLDEDVLWLGSHIHSSFHSPWPGGQPNIPLPKDSPSRAYLKLEEAVLWSGAHLKAGDTAVEIGSAPGGASYALLQRGLHVVGIDPAVMAPVVLNNPGFQHFQCPVGEVLRERLPESIQWLLLDMNVEPRISLFAVDRLASRMKGSLLGVILTVKLNKWTIADQIPDFLEHIRAMGMTRVKAAQLSQCRQEIMIVGLTRKGIARKN